VDRAEALGKVRKLLARAEACPPDVWDITVDEEAFIVSVCELFEIEVPVSVFESSEAASQFLKLLEAAIKP
jgi:hypothetical protein